MVAFVDLQRSFFDAKCEIDRLGERYLVITVFANGDPRADGAGWLIEYAEQPDQPVKVTLSDSLYALYCASTNTVNHNQRVRQA